MDKDNDHLSEFPHCRIWSPIGVEVLSNYYYQCKVMSPRTGSELSFYNFSPDVPGDAAVDQGFVILTWRPDKASKPINFTLQPTQLLFTNVFKHKSY